MLGLGRPTLLLCIARASGVAPISECGSRWYSCSSHAMVATWLQDIKDVWNHYKAVEVGAKPPREFDIDFNPIKSSSGFHQIKVGKPTTANPNPRSDAANWYVNDTRKGLAPHEFGGSL